MEENVERGNIWPSRIWSVKSAIVVAVVFVGVYVVMSVVQAILMADSDVITFGQSLLAVLAGVLAAVLAILVGKAMRGFSWEEFGFRRTARRWYWLALALAPVLAVARIVVAGVLLVVAPDLSAGVEELGDILLGDQQMWQTLVLGFFASLVAPISEEMFFRGFLHNALRMRLPAWAGILLSSALFAAIHLIPLQIVTAFIIALALAWLYEASGSLLPGILLHVSNNVFALALAYAAQWVVERFPDLGSI